MLRRVKCSQRNPRLLGFKVTGTGTAAINQGVFDATLVDNGTGDWTLTWVVPYARAPIPVVSALASAGDIIFCVKAVSSTSCQINGFDATDGTTAKDGIFFLQVLGYDSVDET